MKRITALLFLVILFSGFYAFAQDDYNEKQRELRSYYSNFLREEGFTPQINEKGHIEFKKEGNLFIVSIGDDTKSLYIIIQGRGYAINVDDNLSKCYYACNAINRTYKVGKAFISSDKNSVIFQTQSFFKNKEEFKYVFYRYLDALDGMYADFIDEYNNAPVTTDGGSQSNSVSLFPIYNVTLGKTTIRELNNNGYYLKQTENVEYVNVNDIWFFDDNKDGIVERLFLIKTDNMPSAWMSNFGFDWKLSYNRWKEVLENMGYSVEVTQYPATIDYHGRQTLEAELVVNDYVHGYRIKLAFKEGNDYGDGYSTTSYNTLYSIRVKSIND